ncbi:hypothetical protein H8M03_08405 [Sphingomonas sabuli]|uniref:Uncharacterized protein n=1 Tax=Sphingomonas sabuli TaxID=2764186 RepID=A0A7G9L0A5_9SPHN|nr:hypothetical protein [Sphingomonas sabuli]QNM82054.1 hypothetical protein H8M03_08405 [Sphingomonas sabuli]
MGPGYFIIAILGCADGSAACTQVMTVPTRYESEEACAAATSDALLANSNFDFPSLLAECRPAKAAASVEKAEQPKARKGNA